MAVVAQGNTQQGAMGLLNYFIEYGGRVYSFSGMSGSSRLNSFSDEFLRSMTGFNRLTDPGKISVRPARLAIVTADRTAPFTSFLPTSNVSGLSAEELAILNQVQLSQSVPAGTKLKIPREGADINRERGTSRLRETPSSPQERSPGTLGTP
jgi:predicted Zn-dependent protease